MLVKASRSLRRYTPRDYPLIKSWYKARGKPCPPPAMLSDIGFIADNRVAGWLYVTNSNMAYVEGVISDPDTIPSFRRESMKRLVMHLIDTALAKGHTNIFGIGKHPSVAALAKKMGFLEADYKVWVLRERDDDVESTFVDG